MLKYHVKEVLKYVLTTGFKIKMSTKDLSICL